MANFTLAARLGAPGSENLSSPIRRDTYGVGAALPVNFLLGIQQTGTFRFLIISEALR